MPALTETFMRKYFPVVFNLYQAAWKIHESFGGNFEPWSFAGFIKQQLQFKKQINCYQFYRWFNAKYLQSRYKLQISVIMSSVLFGKRCSHQISIWENKGLIPSDRVGYEVEIIFKFNCNSGKYSVIVHDLQPEAHWIFYVL